MKVLIDSTIWSHTLDADFTHYAKILSITLYE
jgi:hypothetical protein